MLLVKYLKEIEKSMMKALSGDGGNNLEHFKTQIGFIQHERIVHLLVTIAFALFFLLTTLHILSSNALELIPLDILFLILLTAYIIHYYKIENGVQRLYRLYDKMSELDHNKR